MKTHISAAVKRSLTGLLSLAAFVLLISAGKPESEFQILKSRNGIDLYYRWVDVPDGDRVRQMKAVLPLQAGPDEVITLLKDERRATRWISSAEQFRHLSITSPDQWVSYVQFSVPWPLADQDCILEFQSDTRPNGMVTVDFTCNPEFIREVDGVSRIKDISGSFVVRPCADGGCILECYFISKKRSVIPRWITEPIITGNIIGMLEAMRDELTSV